MLFDLETDPGQEHPVIDDEQEIRMATLMRDLMCDTDAPAEQFERMGLPQTGPITAEHLLCRAQAGQVETSRQRPLRASDFPTSRLDVTTPISTLLAEAEAVEVLRRHLGDLVDAPLPEEVLDLGLLDIAGVAVGLIPTATLHQIADELAQL
jgi:hypothetical protein